MKFRFALLFIITTLLSACNFTLAEDVTPPPDYIPPTSLPTLVLHPERAPSIENGAAIYVEKCAACHGDTGLGDGPQGIQLGVTVPAFGLPEVARPLSPAQMYTTVTRGRIDRFMPPFASLNDQERWDVVAYVMTLHTTKEEIQKGKEIFEANCADCSTEYYESQANMSALSTVAVARIIRLGNETIKPFGENLSDEEMWATAEYLRSLSFDASPLAQATAVPATQASVQAEATPLEGTQQAEVQSEAKPGYGSVTGAVENKTGEAISSDTVITLRGYDHDSQGGGAVEVMTIEGSLSADGTFSFEDVEMPEGRIFLAELTYAGVGMKSEYAIAEMGTTHLEIPPLVLYEVSDDTSNLTLEEVHIFVDASNEATYEILALYTILNASETVVAVSIGDRQEIPFIKFPTGSKGLGYEALQDSAPFIGTEKGIAMMPNEQAYGILASSSVVKEKKTSITQPFVLPVASVSIFVPDGLELEGDSLTKGEPQDISGNRYQMYTVVNVAAGNDLTFTVSGSPKTSPATVVETTGLNNNLLIGAVGLGLAFILVGVWMYLRDRNQAEEEVDEDEDEFESSEDVMDAIIALDDLHRAKKISDDAYHKRRAELKEILKGMV